jgi:hypothetical protein
MVVLLTVGLTSLANAQGRQQGSITGKVSDTEGNALPGCTITLEGPNLQGQMTFVSTETGAYRFPSVPPGEDYQVTFEMPGFKTMVRQGLKVSISKDTHVNITLEMSTLEEEVTVVGESPTVDVKVSKTSVNYSKSYIYNIPMSRDLYAVLNSMPGSVSEDVSYRRTSYMAGGTVRGNQYSIDGVTINDPVVMYPMTNINIDVYEEVEMGMFGHSADVSLADGGYVNIVTKSGGNAFHGGGTVEYYNEDMQKGLISPEDLEAVGLTKPSGWSTWQDFSLFLGGPIIKDKIWFFANGRYFKWVQDFNHVVWDDTIVAGERIYTLDDAPHKESNMFGKLTFQLASNLRLLATYNLTTITEDFYTNRVQSYLDKSATTKWDGEKGHTVATQLNWVFSQNLFFDIRVGYIYRFFPIPYSEYAIKDAAWTYDTYYGIYRNTPRFNETYLRTRLNPSVTATWFLDNTLGGNHEWKAGVEYEKTTSNWDWWRENPYYYYHNQGSVWAYATSSEPYRGRIRPYTCGPTEGSSVQENSMQRWGAYIQDSWTIGDKLTLNLGVRFDTSKGFFPEQFKAATADPYGIFDIIVPGQTVYSEFTMPAMDVVRWTHFSPRIGFSYDPFGDGKTSFKGSWSRYNEYLMQQYFSLVNPIYPTRGDWYWFDDNQNGIWDSEDRFQNRFMPVGPEEFELENEIDVDSTAPYTDEFVLGVERELARDFSVGVSFVYKHKQNIFESVGDYGLGKDEAWKGYAENSPYWEKFEFLDPGEDGDFNTDDDQISYVYAELAGAPSPHTILMNVDGAFRKYWAINLIFNKRMSNNWQLLASVVYSKSWGNIGGNYNSSYGGSGVFNTPNSWVFSGGRLDYDRPWNIKLQSTIILPYEFILSGYFNHRSGDPWDRDIRIYIPEDDKYKYPGDYYSSIPTELNGTRRNATVTTLDMRVEKRFRIGEIFSIGAYLDIINLMGRSGYDVTANPGGYLHYEDPDNPTFSRYGTYGDISNAYGNRVYKVSLRFTF